MWGLPVPIRSQGEGSVPVELSGAPDGHRRESILAEKVGEFFGWQRSAEIVTLNFTAVTASQKTNLIVLLYTSCDDFLLRRSRHGDQRRGDCGVAFVCGDVADQRPVQFHHVNGESLQLTQVTVPCAEIVDRELDAEFGQVTYRQCGLIGVIRQ